MKRGLAFVKTVSGIRRISLILSLGVLSLMIIPQASWAIPAWSRKYGASCNMCHRPNVPRLNVVGHTFRKLGYRMEDEIGQNPDYKEIGEYVSMRGRLRYKYNDPEDGEESNEFQWHDATFFYAGPVTKNLSAFFELEVEDDEVEDEAGNKIKDKDEVKVVGSISWFMGTADRYLNIRAGQFHTLTRVGWAGFDRPSGISTTNVFGDTLTTTPVPLKIKEDQQGLELALGVTSDIRLIGQVLNGVNADGESTWGSDDDKDKDFLVAYEHILDERGSGFTLYGYRGIWHDAAGDDDVTEFESYRYGATASAVVDICPLGYTEILGGAILSRDNVPSDHPTETEDIDGEAYFVGIEQYFTDASVFARADFVNKDSDTGDWENKYIVGTAYMVNDYLRLAGEGFWVDKVIEDSDSLGFVLEAMFNF